MENENLINVLDTENYFELQKVILKNIDNQKIINEKMHEALGYFSFLKEILERINNSIHYKISDIKKNVYTFSIGNFNIRIVLENNKFCFVCDSEYYHDMIVNTFNLHDSKYISNEDFNFQVKCLLNEVSKMLNTEVN